MISDLPFDLTCPLLLEKYAETYSLN